MYLYLIFGVNFWSLASMVENSLSAFKRDLAVITDAKYTELFYSLVNNTLDLFIVERFVCVVVCMCGLSQFCVVSLPYINVHAMAVFSLPLGILFRVPSKRTLF